LEANNAKQKMEANRADWVKKMSSSYAGTRLRSIINVPESGKWTKLTPSLDYVVVGNSNNMTLTGVLQAAGRQLEAQVTLSGAKTKSRGSDADIGQDGDHQQQVSWHAAQGKRFKVGVRTVENRRCRELFGAECVVLEEVRSLTCFFLQCSVEQPDPCDLHLFTFANIVTSPVTQCLQHLRRISRGTAPRLQMVFGPLGHRSMVEYVGSQQDYALDTLVLARIVSACVYKRIEQRRKSNTTQAALVVDGRAPEAARKAAAMGVVVGRECCRGHFWVKFLEKDLDGTPLNNRHLRLFDPTWQRVMTSWAITMQKVMSIAALERRNRRSKSIVTQQDMSWDTFCCAELQR